MRWTFVVVLLAGFSPFSAVSAEPTSPAHRDSLHFLRGVNLGNYLEAPRGADWGQRYTAKDFERIRDEGFDHVRIPARWSDHTGPAPDFELDAGFASKVDHLVDRALDHDLAVIVNLHHFDEFTGDPDGRTPKFHRIWEQIAARYADRPETVAFELLNEPRDEATTGVMNRVYSDVIPHIRKTNPTRPLFVGPGNYNNIAELKNLRLPAEDDRLIVTVHSYEPFLFTHQGASWTGDMTATIGIKFPGPPDQPLSPAPASKSESWVPGWIERYNAVAIAQNPSGPIAFEGLLRQAAEWSKEHGRPVHVGEFGAYERADRKSRVNYYRAMRGAIEELGMGWAVWDWKAGFKYWDSEHDRPVEGMREALFSE